MEMLPCITYCVKGTELHTSAEPSSLYPLLYKLSSSPLHPPGHTCGLIKNLALMCYVSVGQDSSLILQALESYNMEPLSEVRPSLIAASTQQPGGRPVKVHKVFVNGIW